VIYKIEHNNKFSRQLVAWKHAQHMKSIDYEELPNKISDNCIIQEKVDGQLVAFNWTKGSESSFSNTGFGVRKELPVLDEIVHILKSHGYAQSTIMGELTFVKKRGVPEQFNQTMSKTRAPESKEDEDKIHFFIFEWYTGNDKKKSDTYEDYLESFKELHKIFKDAKHIYPVDYYIGKDNLKKAWNEFVKDEKNEGIVIRCPNKIIKSKPFFTIDLAVIGVERGTGVNKNRMGALKLAYFDGKHFHLAGRVGTGFSFKDRDDYWALAKKHEVKKEGNVIWVDPYKFNKILEIQYQRAKGTYNHTLEFKKGEWSEGEKEFTITLTIPSFKRLRDDKTVNKADLRMTQVPIFSELKSQYKKSAYRIIKAYFKEYWE